MRAKTKSVLLEEAIVSDADMKFLQERASVGLSGDKCAGCFPHVMNPETLQPCSSDHPFVKVLNQAWARASKEHKDAQHRVVCLKSTDEKDKQLVLELAGILKRTFEEAAEFAPSKPS